MKFNECATCDAPTAACEKGKKVQFASLVCVPGDFTRFLRAILLLAALGSGCGVYAGVTHAPTPRQARDILTAVCPRSHALNLSRVPGSYGGCKPCPPFTEWGELPIGRTSSLELETIIYGSFTAPGAREGVATFGGCVDHANAPDFRSSVVLVRRRGVWRVQPNGYVEGLDTSRCLTYGLRDGREILVCKSFEGHPDVSYEGIFRWDFRAKQPIRELITTINTWGACKDTVLEENISGFSIRRFADSTFPGVSVQIEVVHAKHGGKLGVCAQFGPGPRPTTYHVDFLYTGQDFVVAPSSAETARRLDALFSSARR